MVKPPKIRHSKSRKEPVTIELEPGEVARVEEPQAAAADASPEPVEAPPAETIAAATVDTQAAVGEAPVDETAAPAEGEDNTFFMGSEAPPEPSHAEQPLPEEERVRHAFGRDPDTAPPFGTARADARASAESPIQPVPERKAGAMSAVAAGIIGGVITLLGAGGLQFAGLLPSPGATVAVPAGDEEALAALKAEFAALKQDVDAVKANPGGDTNEAIAIGHRPQLRRPGRVVRA